MKLLLLLLSEIDINPYNYITANVPFQLYGTGKLLDIAENGYPSTLAHPCMNL